MCPYEEALDYCPWQIVSYLMSVSGCNSRHGRLKPSASAARKHMDSDGSQANHAHSVIFPSVIVCSDEGGLIPLSSSVCRQIFGDTVGAFAINLLISTYDLS